MDVTPNIGLRKPGYLEDADIADINYNSDTLDTAIKGIQDDIDEIDTSLSGKASAIALEAETEARQLADTGMTTLTNKFFTVGTEIQENGDIYDCTDFGNYWFSAANSRTISNMPVQLNADVSGGVSVYPIFDTSQGTHRILRRLTFNIGTGAFAFRIFYQWVTSSGVSDWYEVGLTRIEPPTT